MVWFFLTIILRDLKALKISWMRPAIYIILEPENQLISQYKDMNSDIKVYMIYSKFFKKNYLNTAWEIPNGKKW